MRALILNSGTGSRLGDITKSHPKCMTKLQEDETILSRQLRFLEACGVCEVVMTTGPFAAKVQSYVESLNNSLSFRYVKNPAYRTSNYIYSVYLAREHLDDDIVLMHGDLVFEKDVLKSVLQQTDSCVVTSSSKPLPEKDFKAVVQDGYIKRIGVEVFENAVFMQPLYRLERSSWNRWLDEIGRFCERGETGCYAENALNEILDTCTLRSFDIGDRLCSEIDTPEDLMVIRRCLT